MSTILFLLVFFCFGSEFGSKWSTRRQYRKSRKQAREAREAVELFASLTGPARELQCQTLQRRIENGDVPDQELHKFLNFEFLNYSKDDSLVKTLIEKYPLQTFQICKGTLTRLIKLGGSARKRSILLIKLFWETTNEYIRNSILEEFSEQQMPFHLPWIEQRLGQESEAIQFFASLTRPEREIEAQELIRRIESGDVSEDELQSLLTFEFLNHSRDILVVKALIEKYPSHAFEVCKGNFTFLMRLSRAARKRCTRVITFFIGTKIQYIQNWILKEFWEQNIFKNMSESRVLFVHLLENMVNEDDAAYVLTFILQSMVWEGPAFFGKGGCFAQQRKMFVALHTCLTNHPRLKTRTINLPTLCVAATPEVIMELILPKIFKNLHFLQNVEELGN